MFVAVGNHVESLQRVAIGNLDLDGLEPGAWRRLEADEIAQIFVPPAGNFPT
jgi:16S rRNA pseudouridine516 synthase